MSASLGGHEPECPCLVQFRDQPCSQCVSQPVASRPRSHRVAAIPGDGIGQEVVPVAKGCLDKAASRFGFTIEWTDLAWGCQRYLSEGSMMPENGISMLAGTDAVFLGAVGAPGVPDHVSLWGLLIPIRREFDLYVNERPARLMEGIASPLARQDLGIDILVVRENTEGEYSEVGGRSRGPDGEFAVQQAMFTRTGCERIVRHACEQAMKRRGRLAIATKSNGILHTMPFWDDISREVVSAYPELDVSWQHVDALAARIITHPNSLDVIVGSNLFGDILSDVAAAVVGGLGVAPSANINPTGTGPALFEPVHGSAPDIAGRGVANPIGQLRSGALLLEHLGEVDAATALMSAIEQVTKAGITTPDLGGSATTEQVAEAVEEALSATAPADVTTAA